jgi:hypothetical protein
MEIFTGCYGPEGRPQAPEARLFKHADPIDGLFDPFDRNNL